MGSSQEPLRQKRTERCTCFVTPLFNKAKVKLPKHNVNLGKDLTVLAPGGRVVVIGSRGTVEINPRDAMAREGTIMGMVLNNASPAELASIHAGLVAGLRNGNLRPVIGQEIPLAEAPRAHQAVMEPGARGKIVLIP